MSASHTKTRAGKKEGQAPKRPEKAPRLTIVPGVGLCERHRYSLA